MQSGEKDYRATLHMALQGSWVVTVQVFSGTKTFTAPFLLRMQAPKGAPSPGAYPLFTPIGRLKASVSVPVSGGAAAIGVSIGAIGNALVEVQLSDIRRLPTSLRLRTDMLDMPMPANEAVARSMGSGRYVAHMIFSMPGIWRISIANAHLTWTQALIIGKPSGG